MNSGQKIYKNKNLVIEPALNRVTMQQKVIQVEPRTMKLIAYFLSHQGQVLSREELHNHVWGEQQVSDESLSRSISDIRRIFQSIDNEFTCIETIRKVGYRWVMPLENSEHIPSGHARKLKINSQVLLPVAVLGLIVLIAMQYFPEKPPQKSYTIKPVTTLSGLEYYPSVSLDGDLVAFSWRETLTSNNRQLKLLNSQTNQTDNISDNKFASHIAFSADKREAWFLRKIQGQCQLMHLVLGTIPQILTSCPDDAISGLSLTADGKTLLLTTFNTVSQKWQVWTANPLELTNSSLNWEPFILPESKMGLRYPKQSKNGKYLAIVAVKERASTHNGLDAINGTIEILSWPERKMIGSIEAPFEILGMDWLDSETLVLATAEEGLEFKLQTMDLMGKTHVMLNSELPLKNPATDSNKHTWLERWGANKNIYQYEFNKKRLTPYIHSTRWDYSPSVANDKTTVYMSTRSGEARVWLKKPDGEEVMLSNIPAYYAEPTISNDGNKITVINQQNQSIGVYNLENGNLIEEIRLAGKEARPFWSVNNKALYFSATFSGEWEIWQFDLETEELSQITFTGGFEGKEVQLNDTNYIYFRATDDERLWRINSDRTVDSILTLVSEYNGIVTTGWAINKDVLHWISEENKQLSYHQANLLTNAYFTESLGDKLFPLQHININVLPNKDAIILVIGSGLVSDIVKVVPMEPH